MPELTSLDQACELLTLVKHDDVLQSEIISALPQISKELKLKMKLRDHDDRSENVIDTFSSEIIDFEQHLRPLSGRPPR